MNQTQVECSQQTSPPGHHNLPKISIVTPSFNKARFLEDCITSVLDQNYPNLEYFIFDGGSTDQSVDIIKKYERKINFWISEPDKGQSDAINKGFKMASGDLVAWLNADDFYLPGAFITVAQAYQNNTQSSFYFGDGARVDESGQLKSGFFPGDQVLFDREALVFGLNYILQPAAFINRAHLEKINYLDPNLHYVMDADLWIRLSQVAPPMPISARLAASREYSETKTAMGSFPRIEELRRITEKYAGIPMTPGTLCYFLDTLDQLVEERTDVFPRPFRNEVKAFWSATSNLLANYGARPDGFLIAPTSQAGSQQPGSQQPVSPSQKYKPILIRIFGRLGMSK